MKMPRRGMRRHNQATIHCYWRMVACVRGVHWTVNASPGRLAAMGTTKSRFEYNLIRWARSRRGPARTLRALSKETGLSASYLLYIETRQRKPNDAIVEKLAKVLDVDVDLLGLSLGVPRPWMVDLMVKNPEKALDALQQLSASLPKVEKPCPTGICRRLEIPCADCQQAMGITAEQAAKYFPR